MLMSLRELIASLLIALRALLGCGVDRFAVDSTACVDGLSPLMHYVVYRCAVDALRG